MPTSPASPAAILPGIWRFFLRHRYSATDLSMLVCSIAVLTYVAYVFDIFLTGGATTSGEPRIELDEMLLIAAVLLIGLLIFSIRRYRDQKREVARRMASERQVRELAYQDPLTGLPNRRQFEGALQVAAASPPRADAVHAVFMIDLNGFKNINDTYGHDAGDAVLIAIAQRLLAAVREGETVARLGGDEFVVLAQHLMGPEAAANIAKRLLSCFADPVYVRETGHTVGGGIGIALLPSDAETAEETMRKADIALYRAKAERRPAFRYFEEEMDVYLRQRNRIERDLAQALSQDRIQPRFRASRNLANGKTIGFEAVPHWVAEADDEIPPQRFLPIADESGLIHRLGTRLLEQACATAKHWPADVVLTINVLPGQLRDGGLAETILRTLADAGLPATRLQLDIAENLIVQNLAAAKALLGPLRRAGVAIALDHFGTGYSTLYHMQELEFDKIKIDRRLVENMQSEVNDKVVRALAGLALGLGVTVSAEVTAGRHEDESLMECGVNERQSAGALFTAEMTLQLFDPGRTPQAWVSDEPERASA